MDYIDVTIDLETLGLSSDAAIIQMVAIPWSRDAKDTPFLNTEELVRFSAHVDIRSCLLDGFKIEENTVKWWTRQKDEVKIEAFYGERCWPLKDVLQSFCGWLTELQHTAHTETVCLWAQGSDFDISVLRTAFAHYKLDFPINRIFFRDARTFILECGRFAFPPGDYIDSFQNPSIVYKSLPPMCDDDHQTHNAEYDARRTTWNVWSIIQKMVEIKSLAREALIANSPNAEYIKGLDDLMFFGTPGKASDYRGFVDVTSDSNNGNDPV